MAPNFYEVLGIEKDAPQDEGEYNATDNMNE